MVPDETGGCLTATARFQRVLVNHVLVFESRKTPGTSKASLPGGILLPLTGATVG